MEWYTYNEVLSSYGGREVPVEADSIVIGVVSLVADDMFQEIGLMAQDIGKPGTRKSGQCRCHYLRAEKNSLIVCYFSVLIAQYFADLHRAFPSLALTQVV